MKIIIWKEINLNFFARFLLLLPVFCYIFIKSLDINNRIKDFLITFSCEQCFFFAPFFFFPRWRWRNKRKTLFLLKIVKKEADKILAAYKNCKKWKLQSKGNPTGSFPNSWDVGQFEKSLFHEFVVYCSISFLQ